MCALVYAYSWYDLDVPRIWEYSAYAVHSWAWDAASWSSSIACTPYGRCPIDTLFLFSLGLLFWLFRSFVDRAIRLDPLLVRSKTASSPIVDEISSQDARSNRCYVRRTTVLVPCMTIASATLQPSLPKTTLISPIAPQVIPHVFWKDLLQPSIIIHFRLLRYYFAPFFICTLDHMTVASCNRTCSYNYFTPADMRGPRHWGR